MHAHTDATVGITGPGTPDAVQPDIEEHFSRIALEALNNAVKHAAAKNLTVQLADLGDVVALAVSDDGVGDDLRQVHPGHLGLQTIGERAAAGDTLEPPGRVNERTTARFPVPATALQRTFGANSAPFRRHPTHSQMVATPPVGRVENHTLVRFLEALSAYIEDVEGALHALTGRPRRVGAGRPRQGVAVVFPPARVAWWWRRPWWP